MLFAGAKSQFFRSVLLFAPAKRQIYRSVGIFAGAKMKIERSVGEFRFVYLIIYRWNVKIAAAKRHSNARSVFSRP